MHERGRAGFAAEGDVDWLDGAIFDVTERKRAEQELRDAEERYRALFENANDLVFTLDREGHFTSLNRALENATGYGRDELLALNIAEIIAAEYLPAARCAVAAQAAREQAEATVYELELVAKDGRRLPLELATRLIVEHGQVLGVQGIGRDIGERKQPRGAAPSPGVSRLADRAAQPRPVRRPRRARPRTRRRTRPYGRRPLPRPRRLQDRQRHLRPRGRRPAAGSGRRPPARLPAPGRHRRPPGRRRVRRPARGRARRPALPCTRRTDPRPDRRPVRGRRQAAVRARQPRHRPRRRAARPPRATCCATPTSRCTRRRRAGGQRFLLFEPAMRDSALRDRNDSDRRAAAAAIERRRARPPLPADRRAANRRDRRRRGARPLAAPQRGLLLPGEFIGLAEETRADHAARPLRAQRRLPPGCGAGSRPFARRAGPLAERQPVGAPAERPEARRGCRPTRSNSPG